MPLISVSIAAVETPLALLSAMVAVPLAIVTVWPLPIGRRRAGGVATQRDGRAIDHNLFVRPVEQTAHREAELLDGLPGFDGAGVGAGEHRHRRRLRAQARRLGKRRAERRRRQRRRVIHPEPPSPWKQSTLPWCRRRRWRCRRCPGSASA